MDYEHVCPKCFKNVFLSALYLEWACSDPSCINAHGPGAGGGWPLDLYKMAERVNNGTWPDLGRC